SLQNEQESLFKYNHPGENFTFYNKHHTRPKFLDDLVGNLTALFENFTQANIRKFNNTCRNNWNNEPNEQCLLTIARTGNYSLGVAVMQKANSTRHEWEILHNKPPEFSNGFPHNITVQYENGFVWSINVTDFVTDDLTKQQDLKFEVQTKLPKSEYTFENDTGIFTWTVGTGLRYIDTDIVFFVIDGFNAKAQRAVTINYCGCEEPEQCSSVTSNSNSTDNVKKASCNCPEYATGLYCEKIKDTCPDIECYQKDLCNATTYRLLDSWPCAPCPNGRHQVMTLKQQTCEDIDECDSDYTGKDKCQQLCNNSIGSFTCDCRSGYTLNADKRTCDDIDECKLSPSNCAEENEVCQNTIGNFSCICMPGYSKKNGVCKQTEGSKYVGYMSFTISATTEHFSEINKTIDTPENRKDVQLKLAAGFNNTKGFLSVEVFRLRVVIHQGKRRRRAADQYGVRADYVVHWKNVTDIKVIGEKLLDSFRNFTSQNGTLKKLKVGNVDISLSSAENHINNATTEGGLCLVPGKTDCAPNSTHCIDEEHGDYECQCKNGYSRAYLSKIYCSDINECDAFKKNGTIGERCVHGSCYNSVGSWNCTCPAGRQWQDVGNATFPVYRCQ
ncbi:fibrillin-1-like, partial [Mercenaria mercenaria]|uniref:fibrillin-1-like n=1 Tax=Mercenaria mercenaria TaxID=6596 RepID=UPI00234E5F39